MRIVISFLLIISSLYATALNIDLSPIISSAYLVFVAMLSYIAIVYGYKKILYLFETSEYLYNKEQDRSESNSSPSSSSFSSSAFQIKDNSFDKKVREVIYTHNRTVNKLQSINDEISSIYATKKHSEMYLTKKQSLRVAELREQRQDMLDSLSKPNNSEIKLEKNYKSFDTNRGDKYNYDSIIDEEVQKKSIEKNMKKYHYEYFSDLNDEINLTYKNDLRTSPYEREILRDKRDELLTRRSNSKNY